ncbi:MAG: beta-lactamase family protein, partial [Sneathiella sp.]|nr:beta-lactamase family protein [Sneathiella sp.]
MTTPDFFKLDELLSSYVTTNRLAGVVAAVISPTETLFSKVCGFQDVESKSPMAWNSIFRIYSMTKPVTSIAAMMLWEEGAFDLDDPVYLYLPSYKNTKVMEKDGTVRPANKPMTIRHLLCHTAGLT